MGHVWTMEQMEAAIENTDSFPAAKDAVTSLLDDDTFQDDNRRKNPNTPAAAIAEASRKLASKYRDRRPDLSVWLRRKYVPEAGKPPYPT